MRCSQRTLGIRPRKDHRGIDLISDGNAIDYTRFRSRSHRPVIRAKVAAGNVIETHEHAGDFKEP